MSIKAKLPSLLVLVAFSLLDLACHGRVSEEEVAHLFLQNQSSFEELIEMIEAKPELEMISERAILTKTQLILLRDEPSGYRKVLTEQEWSHYQQLLRRLGLNGGVKRAPENSLIYFCVTSPSIWNGDSEEGLVHAKKPLTVYAGNLDDYRPTARDRNRYGGYLKYKKIRSEWYIFKSIN